LKNNFKLISLALVQDLSSIHYLYQTMVADKSLMCVACSLIVTAEDHSLVSNDFTLTIKPLDMFGVRPLYHHITMRSETTYEVNDHRYASQRYKKHFNLFVAWLSSASKAISVHRMLSRDRSLSICANDDVLNHVMSFTDLPASEALRAQCKEASRGYYKFREYPS